MRRGLLALVLLIACDKDHEIPAPSLLPPSTSTPRPSNPAPSAPDPTVPGPETGAACAIVTPADVTELTGKTYDPPTDANVGCTYQKGDDMVIAIVMRQGGAQMWESMRTSAADATAVTLPRGAGWRLPNTGVFALLVGDAFVSVSILSEVPEAKVETVMKRIAARL